MFVLIGITNLCFAQDVIILTTGEEIKSKVLEVGITEIQYRKTEGKDTTLVVLNKSDINKIKYKSGRIDVFNEEKPVTDIITLKTWEKIRAKVIEIGITEIQYKKANDQDSSIIIVKKSDVLEIRYKSGRIDSFGDEASKEEDYSGYTDADGMRDAASHYPLKHTGAGGVIAVTIFSPLIGSIPASICGSAVPKQSNMGLPNPKIYENNGSYREGYKYQAHQMKKIKVWRAFGGVCGAYVGLILVTSFYLR